MAENLNLNVNVNTSGAEGSIGSLKKQLREAANEVVNLSDKFGATSVQAVNAAKKAAELRDRIGDAKALTDAFNPDQKFRALTSSLAGVAGGFAAVQGAMGLFGSESENLQKTLVKVQSAMALSQGLEAVGNSVDAFKNLGTVIRTQVVTAFSTLRGAIISTGVGALVVGIGLLIANFEKVKETLLNLFPSLAEFGNKVQSIIQSITDFAGITSEASRAQDALKLALETSNKAIDNQIKILEAQGNKENEIYEQKKQRINNQIKLIKGSSQEELQTRADLNTELQVLEIQEAKRKDKKAKDDKIASDKEAADLIASNEAKIAAAREYEEFDTQLQQRLLELDEERAAKKRELDFQNTQNLITDIDYENELLDNDFAEDQQRLANKEAYIAELKAIELSNLNLTEKERLDIISKYAKMEQDIDKDITASKKAEAQAKIDIQLKYIDFVGQAGNLLGQIAGKNKDLAIAGIVIEQGAALGKLIIQTMAANSAATTAAAPFLANPITAIPASINLARVIAMNNIQGVLSGAGIIAGAAKGIAAINSAKTPSGGGGGAGGASMPSMSTAAPMSPQLPQAQTTNLSQQTINDIGNQAVRAYVVESDVTSSQERITAIRQRARFS